MARLVSLLAQVGPMLQRQSLQIVDLVGAKFKDTLTVTTFLDM